LAPARLSDDDALDDDDGLEAVDVGVVAVDDETEEKAVELSVVECDGELAGPGARLRLSFVLAVVLPSGVEVELSPGPVPVRTAPVPVVVACGRATAHPERMTTSRESGCRTFIGWRPRIGYIRAALLTCAAWGRECGRECASGE